MNETSKIIYAGLVSESYNQVIFKIYISWGLERSEKERNFLVTISRKSKVTRYRFFMSFVGKRYTYCFCGWSLYRYKKTQE